MPKWIFQKTSGDQQGERRMLNRQIDKHYEVNFQFFKHFAKDK